MARWDVSTHRRPAGSASSSPCRTEPRRLSTSSKPERNTAQEVRGQILVQAPKQSALDLLYVNHSVTQLLMFYSWHDTTMISLRFLCLFVCFLSHKCLFGSWVAQPQVTSSSFYSIHSNEVPLGKNNRHRGAQYPPLHTWLHFFMLSVRWCYHGNLPWDR